MLEDFRAVSVVVTGAARGNGAAIAKGFARAGAVVWVCDRLEAELKQTVDEINAEGVGRAIGYILDVTDAEACRQLADRVNAEGAASVLVNNAGICPRVPLSDDGFSSAWDMALAVNATGPMAMVQAFLSQLQEKRGSVVNIASIMSFVGGKNLVAYAASKGAIGQMTKAMASEFAPLGIRVNAIAPGVISTPMTEVTRQNPDAINAFMMHTPMKRPGEPEELIGPVMFLASPAASYVTGAILPVDGGYLAA